MANLNGDVTFVVALISIEGKAGGVRTGTPTGRGSGAFGSLPGINAWDLPQGVGRNTRELPPLHDILYEKGEI